MISSLASIQRKRPKVETVQPSMFPSAGLSAIQFDAGESYCTPLCWTIAGDSGIDAAREGYSLRSRHLIPKNRRSGSALSIRSLAGATALVLVSEGVSH